MVGWLRRIFGRRAEIEAPAAAPVTPGEAPARPAEALVVPTASQPASPAYVPNQPNPAALAAQALSAHSWPLPAPAASPPPEVTPAAQIPAAPELGADERLILLQVARGSGRRARPAVVAALQDITGDRPNLNRVPNRAQVARALHRLGRDPARVAALLEQVERLAGAARRR